MYGHVPPAYSSRSSARNPVALLTLSVMPGRAQSASLGISVCSTAAVCVLFIFLFRYKSQSETAKTESRMPHTRIFQCAFNIYLFFFPCRCVKDTRTNRKSYRTCVQCVWSCGTWPVSVKHHHSDADHTTTVLILNGKKYKHRTV